ERERLSKAAGVVHGDLRRLGWRLAFDVHDAHAVRRLFVERDGVETRRDVRIEVRRAPDLVEELRRDRADRDETALRLVLRDDGRPVGRDLRDRETGTLQSGHLLEEGVVAAGALRA